jgi:hypothetical protein
LSHERAEYRIVYPFAARAQLRVGGTRIAVIDCSEKGLRLELASSVVALADAEGRLSGRLRLAQGVEIDVTGRVLRTEDASFAILLEESSRIPLPVIYEEQRHLRARFPEWK